MLSQILNEFKKILVKTTPNEQVIDHNDNLRSFIKLIRLFL